MPVSAHALPSGERLASFGVQLTTVIEEFREHAGPERLGEESTT
ncbi:hypothetical protein [Streptomyces montanus]|nr:hypothetical protein [Streptomyces montanus]